MLMRYSDVIGLLGETGLSPEDLAGYLRISNMTYRRWQKEDAEAFLPQTYERVVAGGIYQLLEDGRLDLDSNRVAAYLKVNLPEFFGAVTGGLGFADFPQDGGDDHEEMTVRALAKIGAGRKIRTRIDKAGKALAGLGRMGEEWRRRIAFLVEVVGSNREISKKAVAYGALFYLLTPLDLIPDSIPVVGFIDDFGILGFALGFYAKQSVLPTGT